MGISVFVGLETTVIVEGLGNLQDAVGGGRGSRKLIN